MDETPRESAEKPLVLAPWGSRFVDLNAHPRKDELARHFFGIFFARSWNALSGHTTATPAHPALPSDPQGIRGDCKEIRRGVVDTVKPQGQHTRARHVSRVAQGTRLRDQRAEIRRSTPA